MAGPVNGGPNGEACRSCYFFDNGIETLCRKQPAKLAVRSWWWCGEYKPRESDVAGAAKLLKLWQELDAKKRASILELLSLAAKPEIVERAMELD